MAIYEVFFFSKMSQHSQNLPGPAAHLLSRHRTFSIEEPKQLQHSSSLNKADD
jgi:hypothetical protein